ncbi:hypothetical protein RHGRI_030179 [Rhododendron griersonianum]|uniref:KIB1-4 beta-propeller domain-containing protein n=1 Tax=Rhododendron griersonianum TaxID=479676 RepID=A0AAV6IQG1_9ERIC|nr:hypothetical protein RHGRI_030179 [Rhododendron griersonianum]
MVIGISSHTPEHTEFCIITRGEDMWTYQDMVSSLHFIISDASPVLYNGKLYCLGEAGNLGVLDLRNNIGWTSWEVCSMPLSRSSCRKFRQSFVVKCDDGMLVVYVTHEDRRVLVEKWYLPKMLWEDVESLGDKMVFVSHGASLLEDAVDKGMANKIYFPKFHGESGVYYSLDTEMYHSILGNANKVKCYLDAMLNVGVVPDDIYRIFPCSTLLITFVSAEKYSFDETIGDPTVAVVVLGKRFAFWEVGL